MSDISLIRKIFSNNSTIGQLTMDDLTLWTLEDTARNIKIDGQTCIPSGVYEIQLQPSSHFNRLMPFLQEVPFYTGIMIHPGNTPLDTNGCILVGMDHQNVGSISDSRQAFDLLFPKIESALKQGPLKINIAGGFTKDEFSLKKNGNGQT